MHNSKTNATSPGCWFAVPIVALIGLLLFVGLFFLQNTETINNSTKQLKRDSNLRQIWTALREYEKQNGSFPRASVSDETGKALLSWRVVLLPFLHEKHLFDAFDLTESWDSPRNMHLLLSMPDVFFDPCRPEIQGEGKTYFLGVEGNRAFFGEDTPMTMAFLENGDQLTKAIMIVEGAKPVPWTCPTEFKYEQNTLRNNLGYRNQIGFHALFADGRVEFVHFDDSNLVASFQLR
jgi:hypothetical protein